MGLPEPRVMRGWCAGLLHVLLLPPLLPLLPRVRLLATQLLLWSGTAGEIEPMGVGSMVAWVVAGCSGHEV